jgi:hypothetical protein
VLASFNIELLVATNKTKPYGSYFNLAVVNFPMDFAKAIRKLKSCIAASRTEEFFKIKTLCVILPITDMTSAATIAEDLRKPVAT